jgi:transcriptional regulator GlxA family with amidase domain
MQIAILTFDGFNEIDSFVAASILNRLRPDGWSAYIASPTPTVSSMNGVIVERQKPIEFAGEADAVIVGSGKHTREIAQDSDLLARIRLDPSRQLIGAQCSGALLLAKMGLLHNVPACTDMTTKPWVVEAGVEVLDAPFFAAGNVATAGGCLASQYLAAWIMLRGAGEASAARALHYVAPVGEQDAFVAHALSVVRQDHTGSRYGSRELIDVEAAG